MENNKIAVKSMTTGRVGVIAPDLHFQRFWPNKGAKIMIEKSMIEDLMYNNSFRYMVETGILYIDDMQTKIDLGLEEEGTTTPTNIIPLEDADMRALMVVKPFNAFKDIVDKLNYEQIQNLVDYAILNELGDYHKCEYIRKKCGKDILNAIKLNAQDKEV